MKKNKGIEAGDEKSGAHQFPRETGAPAGAGLPLLRGVDQERMRLQRFSSGTGEERTDVNVQCS